MVPGVRRLPLLSSLPSVKMTCSFELLALLSREGSRVAAQACSFNRQSEQSERGLAVHRASLRRMQQPRGTSDHPVQLRGGKWPWGCLRVAVVIFFL